MATGLTVSLSLYRSMQTTHTHTYIYTGNRCRQSHFRRKPYFIRSALGLFNSIYQHSQAQLALYELKAACQPKLHTYLFWNFPLQTSARQVHRQWKSDTERERDGDEVTGTDRAPCACIRNRRQNMRTTVETFDFCCC